MPEAIMNPNDAPNELSRIRIFNAPRELVWRAWTEPTHIAKWWGPKGFTNTIYEMDVRPGGVWRFMMHGPDGVDYPSKIIYRIVDAPSHLAYSHAEVPPFDVDVRFDEEGNKTRVNMRMIFVSEAERDKVAKDYGAIEGLDQTLDRLETFAVARERYRPGPATGATAQTHGEKATLLFTRDFAHPVEKVWRALTSPEALREWSPFESTRDLSSVGAATILMIGGPTPEPSEIEVLRAEAPKLLEYTWGGDLLCWELHPTAQGTRLVLKHTVQDKSWLSKVAAGWHISLDVAAAVLSSAEIGRIVAQDAMHFDWERLQQEYEALLQK
jgi:uncharacterized protein YndB with AHSA1/START domain